jgi:hypothetical protein
LRNPGKDLVSLHDFLEHGVEALLNLFGSERLGWRFQRFTEQNNGLPNKPNRAKPLIMV